jgi:hypothetical protein
MTNFIEYHGINFAENGDRLTVDIVNALGFGAKLPHDYMSFLLTVNGGIPDKNIFNVKAPGYSNITSIDGFLGVSAKYGCNILSYLNSYKEYEGIIPDYMLQIATDISGDPIFIALKMNHSRGKIYYWDHDYAYHSDESYDPNVPILIANSFDEFLSKLYSKEELDTSKYE